MSEPQTAGQANPFNFQSLSVLQFLFKWRWHIVGATMLAGLAAVVFSGPAFIMPKYASTVVFYPASAGSISSKYLSNNNNSEDPLAFGEEEQSEQLMQILLSEQLQDKIVKKYDLEKHYNLDTTDAKRYYHLNRAYAINVRFRRTEYNSVEIKVLDTDPKLAAAMANDIAQLLDETKQSIQKDQAIKGLNVVQSAYDAARANIARMNDSMQFLRGKGVFDYGVQTELITEDLIKNRSILATERAKLQIYQANNLSPSDTTVIRTKARIAGAKSATRNLELQMDMLARYGGAYSVLDEQIKESSLQIVELGTRLENARVDAEQVVPVKIVVNSARVSDNKVYPVRWLIVAIAAAGAFVFSVVSLVIYENYLSLAKRPAQLRKTA